MQISMDVHNYMETLVGQRLADDAYSLQFTSEQLADLACLALVQLRPVYIRHDIDFLSTLPEIRLEHFKENVAVAIDNAKDMIINDRRKLRQDDNLPVIFNQPGIDQDEALDWFEKPIISFIK